MIKCLGYKKKSSLSRKCLLVFVNKPNLPTGYFLIFFHPRSDFCKFLWLHISLDEFPLFLIQLLLNVECLPLHSVTALLFSYNCHKHNEEQQSNLGQSAEVCKLLLNWMRTLVCLQGHTQVKHTYQQSFQGVLQCRKGGGIWIFFFTCLLIFIFSSVTLSYQRSTHQLSCGVFCL